MLLLFQALALGFERGNPLIEGLMCFHHGTELLGFAFEKEFEGGHVVKNDSAEQDPRQSALMQVLVCFLQVPMPPVNQPSLEQ